MAILHAALPDRELIQMGSGYLLVVSRDGSQNISKGVGLRLGQRLACRNVRCQD